MIVVILYVAEKRKISRMNIQGKIARGKYYVYGRMLSALFQDGIMNKYLASDLLVILS